MLEELKDLVEKKIFTQVRIATHSLGFVADT